jgi:hypothetical protein
MGLAGGKGATHFLAAILPAQLSLSFTGRAHSDAHLPIPGASLCSLAAARKPPNPEASPPAQGSLPAPDAGAWAIVATEGQGAKRKPGRPRKEQPVRQTVNQQLQSAGLGLVVRGAKRGGQGGVASLVGLCAAKELCSHMCLPAPVLPPTLRWPPLLAHRSACPRCTPTLSRTTPGRCARSLPRGRPGTSCSGSRRSKRPRRSSCCSCRPAQRERRRPRPRCPPRPSSSSSSSSPPRR